MTPDLQSCGLSIVLGLCALVREDMGYIQAQTATEWAWAIWQASVVSMVRWEQ